MSWNCWLVPPLAVYWLMRVPEVSVFWRDAVLGGLILFAIAIDFAIGKRLRRLWASPARRSRETPEREARTDA